MTQALLLTFLQKAVGNSVTYEDRKQITFVTVHCRGYVNTLRTGSFKLFKRPFPGFLTILTL